MRPHALIAELAWRGLLNQQTDGIDAALRAGQLVAYCGFDPSASSLHVGNLVPVMGLVHLQRHGHRPIALVGGGTGLIGDPSGKSQERQLLGEDEVAANAASIRGQLSRFLDFDGPNRAEMRNNADWLVPMPTIHFLRDVGKHFTVNYMLQKESVKGRMEGGISFTEFSYMLLQAYDFLELRRRDGVTMQIGGSDQWGNITAGIELIRRAGEGAAHGLTVPLVTTAAGTKFGKSEAGAVWLDPSRTSPYKFYQFWYNTDDRDVGKYLRYFSLLSKDEVEALDRASTARPEARDAQRELARDVTGRVHGADAVRTAEEVAGFFFGQTDPGSLSSEALELLRAEAPYVEVDESAVRDSSDATRGRQLDVLKLLTASGLAASTSAARRLLEQGGISVNRRKLSASDRYVAGDEVLLHGHYIVVGKGKRDFVLLRVK